MIAAMALALSLSAGCPLEMAHYQLRSMPKTIAGFRQVPKTADWPNGIAFYIHIGKIKRTFWFLPYSGNGQGIGTHLASTTDVDAPGWLPPDPDSGEHRPLGDTDYLGADAKYNFDQAFHMYSGQPAAAHLFLPQLQEVFWYRVEPKVGMPMAFFDLTSCGNK